MIRRPILAWAIALLVTGCDPVESSPADAGVDGSAAVDGATPDADLPDADATDAEPADALPACTGAEHCGGDRLAVANCRCPDDAPICLRRCAPCSPANVGHIAQTGEVCVEPGVLVPPCDDAACAARQMRCGGDPGVDGGCVPLHGGCFDARFAEASADPEAPVVRGITFLSAEEPQPGFAGPIELDCGPRPGMRFLIELEVEVEPSAVPLTLAWIGLDDAVYDAFPAAFGQGAEAGGYVYRGGLCWHENSETRLVLQVIDALGRASGVQCALVATDAQGA